MFKGSISRRQLLAALPMLAAAPAKQQRPNVILILADDLGGTDLGCFGSDFYQTPNLDRLASKGMRFTSAYSACTVCSPSRAAIMTGKYPARLHITDWIPGHPYGSAKLQPPDWRQYLPLEERTIAEALKDEGYATAHIGKWHLGNEPYYPTHQGFDSNTGGTFRGSPPSYFSPYKIATLPDGPPGEYLTDREGDEAAKFIDANRARPFFLYLAHHAVHNPVQAKADMIKRYQAKQPGAHHSKPAYAAMIESMDASVGKVMAKLEQSGLDENTIVIFTSDNGGLMQNTSNSPFRVGKGSAYEGGVRVPMIVRWPGHTPKASECKSPVMGMDLYPTVLEMTGAKREKGQIIDGESLAPLCRQSGSLRRQSLYWHYPHYHPGGATPYSAIRQNDWRLVEFQEDGHAELYNLAKDIGEQEDLAAKMPEKTRELRAALDRWRREVGAQMAVPNPNYDPSKAKKVGKLAPEAED